MALPSPGTTKDPDIERALRRIRETFPLSVEKLQVSGGSDGDALTKDSTAPGGLTWGGGGYICIRDEKAANTAGGTFTSGAWQTRDLNTEAADTGNHASLASNQITLAAGTYRCRIVCPGEAVGIHKARLRNITDGTTLLVGTNAWTDTYSGNAPLTLSTITGRFTITASKTIEVQHRCSQTSATLGFGAAANFGEIEVYTTVELWREP